MPEPTLDYAVAKTAWAKNKLDSLKKIIDEYLASEPYAITKADDIENSRHIIRLELKPVPFRPPLVLGDFAYALRSALDQLAWQLALLTTADPGRKTCFPIHHGKDTKSEAIFREIVWDIPCEAIEQIRLLQPYTRGDRFKEHPLWQLNYICNLDKHRIFPMRSVHGTFDIFPPNSYAVIDFDYGCDLVFDLSLKEEIRLEPGQPCFIFGEPLESIGPGIDIGYDDIAAIYNFVRNDVLPRFERFLANSGDIKV